MVFVGLGFVGFVGFYIRFIGCRGVYEVMGLTGLDWFIGRSTAYKSYELERLDGAHRFYGFRV